MNFLAEFFLKVGIESTILISIPGLSMLLLLIINGFKIKVAYLTKQKTMGLVNELAILSLVLGVFMQLVGLYGAFEAIGKAGSVSMGLLAFGINVSMHSTFYGFLYFLIGKIAVIFMKLKEEN